MNVQQLIQQLQKLPPQMEVTVWSDFDDEWVPVTLALHEDGVSHISLLTENPPPVTIPAEPEEA